MPFYIGPVAQVLYSQPGALRVEEGIWETTMHTIQILHSAMHCAPLLEQHNLLCSCISSTENTALSGLGLVRLLPKRYQHTLRQQGGSKTPAGFTTVCIAMLECHC